MNPSHLSEELQQNLDQIAERLPRNQWDEVAEKLGDASLLLSYEVCTWWNGCYYCRDEQGNWHKVKCFT